MSLPRVLLVDDDSHLLASLDRVLAHHCEIDVVTASSPKLALEQLDSGVFAVLVSDAALPGLSGPALLALAATRWPEMWRVLYTGHATGEPGEFIPGAEFADLVLSKAQSPALVGEKICELARTTRGGAAI